MEEHIRKSSSDTSPAEFNWKNGKERRRTSILKPPKLRTPLKELQFTSTQEVKDDTAARPSRRVSFGHFHVRKFGYENGVVCDSIYSFESSKSESSSQANNSVGENNEVPATNSSHHCKNMSPESINYKEDSHTTENICQNTSKHNCAEADNKSNVTDIGVKQQPDDSPGFSAIDIVPHRHSCDVLNSKSYIVRTDYKDNQYFQNEDLMGLNSVVSDKMQSVHEQEDIKQLHGLAKQGREQCEQKNEANAHNCEHHLNSATVTDMELADSYSFGHIEFKEESLLGRKRKKSVDTTEKSFHFAAESDMELTKVIDTACYGEVLNQGKEKSISLNKTMAINNLIVSSDDHISNNVKDCDSMKIVSQQPNSTQWFSTNNGMDITEGCRIVDGSSHSDIPNDGIMVLTKVIDTSCYGVALNQGKAKSISLNKSRAENNLISSKDGHINSDVKDCNSMKNVSQQLNSTKRFSTNNGMDITEGYGIIDSSSHSDIPNDGIMVLTKVIDPSCYGKALNQGKEKSISLNQSRAENNLISSGDSHISSYVKDCKSVKNVSQQLNSTKRFSTNNGMDITEGCGIIDSSSHSDIPNDGIADEVNSHILSISRLSMDEEDGDRNEEKTNLNPIEFSEKSFINESMEQTVAVGHVLSDGDMDYRNAIKDFRRNESVSRHLEFSDDLLPINGEKCSIVTTAATLLIEDKLTDPIEKCRETKPDDINNFNTSKTILMCVDMESTQNTCHNDQDNSIMQFTRVVECNIQDSSMQDSLVSLGNKHTSHSENLNIEKKNKSAVEKSTWKHDMEFTQVKSPLCDSGNVPEIVATERQTDASVTATSSKIFSCKDKQNDCVSSPILDTKPDHPLILKPCGNEADSSVFMLSEKTNHANYCKERFYEDTVSNIIKQTEYGQDRSVKCISPCQTVDKNSKICTESSKLKSEIIQHGSQANNVGSNLCRVLSNSSVIQDTVEFCVKPYSETENIAKTSDSASKILLKYPECQPYCGNRSELHHLSTQAAEDYLVKGNETQCALGSEMSSKKRRSSENEETREGTKSRKKQYIASDHISDKQHLQTTAELSGLAVETKVFYERDTTTVLRINSGVVNTAMSERPTHKIVGVPSDTNSVQANNKLTLLETDRINVSLPQPSDPNSKLNFSCRAKTIVFNNPSVCGLDFTCETSSVAIETADCKNNLCGSTLVTDKRNTDSPLPENEALKRNNNDGNVFDRSKTYGQKKYPRYSEEASSSTGTATNISEVNFPQTLLREDKNLQHIEDSAVLQRNSAAQIDDDKNNLFSETESNAQTTVTFRRRRRYESNVASLSLMQKDIEIRDYCTETGTNKPKSVVTNNAELSRDVGQTTALSQSRYEESITSVKGGHDQTLEGMEICNSSGNESSFRETDAAIHHADKTFHSWYCDKRAFIGNGDSAPSAVKINHSNSYPKTFGTTKSYPAQAPDVANEAIRLNYLTNKKEGIGQNVTQDNNSLDFKVSEGYLSTEIQLAQAKEKISAVQINSTSNYLINNGEQNSFSESCAIISCDRECLKQAVQEKVNSSFGKEMGNQQFNYDDPVKRPDVCVEVLNVTSDTNNSQEPKEKCHDVRNILEASEPVEASQPMGVSQQLEVNKSMGASQPLEFNRPVGASQPLEASEPIEGKQPMEGNDPMGANQPMGASQPLEVNRPMGASQPLEASEPIEGNQPMEANHPMGANQPMEASQPLQVNRPLGASKLLEVSQALEVNQLLEVHEPLEVIVPPKVNIPCETDLSYHNTQKQGTPEIVKDFCSVTNTAQSCFPMVLGTELHTLPVDRAQDLLQIRFNAREGATAVSPPMKYIRQCSRSVSIARDFTSKTESPKIGITIDGVGDTGGSPIFCSGRQNSECDSLNDKVAVRSESLYTTAKKMNNRTGKQEITVVKGKEEKPVENKCKKLENIIISQAERSEVLWNIRAMNQFQWIFTFLNDTLRLYIHFDKPAEEGSVQELNLISHLTGKADEDAKFVHFVLMKKFSKDKLKTLCEDIEDVPKLLEKISVDVHRMLTFLYEFQKVQLLYNMEIFGTSVSFNIISYKLAICFKMNIDLSNWEQILEDSITITQKYGHVNEAEVKNLAKGVERNSYFLRNYFKAVQQYMKILERFGC